MISIHDFYELRFYLCLSSLFVGAIIASQPVTMNIYFNLLQGERECPYYMRNGSCKYASNCRFNHPDPTAAGGSDPASAFGNGGPASLQGAPQSTVAPWSAPRSLNETPLYVPMMIPPSQGVPSQNTEWNGYQVHFHHFDIPINSFQVLESKISFVC